MKKFITNLARSLRRKQTPEEVLLWKRLRGRKFCGLKFLRQHPIVVGGTDRNPEFFVVDFFCAEKQLVIEVDGKIHDSQLDYDRARDGALGELHLHVLRIKNEELTDVEAVLSKIRNLTDPSLHRREGCPSDARTGVS